LTERCRTLVKIWEEEVGIDMIMNDIIAGRRLSTLK